MSNYTIKANETWSNSHEVYFDNKPDITVIKALKAAGMRWNPKKQCWYGFKTERELIDIIQSDTDSATVYTDGYLGGRLNSCRPESKRRNNYNEYYRNKQ